MSILCRPVFIQPDASVYVHIVWILMNDTIHSRAYELLLQNTRG